MGKASDFLMSTKGLMFTTAIGGSLIQMYAPSAGVTIGNHLAKPLDILFQTYITITFYSVLFGQQDYKEILKNDIMPLVMIIIPLGSFIKLGIDINWYIGQIFVIGTIVPIVKNLFIGGGFLGFLKEQSSGWQEDLLDSALGKNQWEKGEKGAAGSASDWGRAAATEHGLLVQSAEALTDLKQKVREYKHAVATLPAGHPHIDAAKTELKEAIDTLKAFYESKKDIGLKNKHTKNQLEEAKKLLR